MSSSPTADLPFGDEIASLLKRKVTYGIRLPNGQPKTILPDGKEYVDKKLVSQAISPDAFEPERHFYPRVLNAHLHPMVSTFLALGNEGIIARYAHLHPKVDKARLTQIITTPPRIFSWAGADLFNVTNDVGNRQMIIVETNSCPSGQKSMPQPSQEANKDGYHALMANTFKYLIERDTAKLPAGGLAVLYDKNPMEAFGYASAMATTFNETVYIAALHEDDENPPVKWEGDEKVLHVKDDKGEWHPIRACFRYVTQRPWSRIPIVTKTLVLNPVASCLAGGRNKMAADKAYEMWNKQNAVYGLEIRTPQTIRDVTKSEIPMWVKSMGGHAVVKVPYSNAGQGVYTITSPKELEEFMQLPNRYDKFIVQSLVGNASWSSMTTSGQYFHTGTIPNKKKQTFVMDLRMMISGTASGFSPVSLYARRAQEPLAETLAEGKDSWSMLGTNLSKKKSDGSWDTETERLLMMDSKDFNRLGLGIDDLIDAYVQTVLATVAIDKMASKLFKSDGSFDIELYSSLNSDEALLNELWI